MYNHKKTHTRHPTSGQDGSASIFLLLIIGGVLTYCAATYHFVMTDHGIKTYQKQYPGFVDTYTDIRQVPLQELGEHQELIAVMAKHGDLRYIPGGMTVKHLKKAGRQLTSTLTEIDKNYRISDSTREAARIGKEKYRQMDNRYNIKEKTKRAATKFNNWLHNQ